MRKKNDKDKAALSKWGSSFDGELVISKGCLSGTELYIRNSYISRKGNSCKKPL